MAKMKVDFSGVSDSGAVAVGRHLAKVAGVSKEQGEEYPYLKWDLVIVGGVSNKLHINHITSLKPSALFNLRNTLEALGVSVPKAAISFDPEALVGKTLGIEVFLRESDGKEYANVKKVFKPETKAKATKVEEPEEDEDDDDEIADFDDDDDELEL